MTPTELEQKSVDEIAEKWAKESYLCGTVAHTIALASIKQAILEAQEPLKGELEEVKELLDLEIGYYRSAMATLTAIQQERDLLKQRVKELESTNPADKSYTEVIERFNQELIVLKEKVKELEKDKERLSGLRKLMGYVQTGESETVKLYQDDATYDYFVTVGKQSYFAESFNEAIDTAIEQFLKGEQKV